MNQSDCNTSSAFDEFCEKNKHLSHSEHLLLHPGFSPGSRVPCTNVLSFVSKLLMSGDTNSITKLMRQLVSCNWASEIFEEIYQLDVKRFISFSNDMAEIEFKAMCLLFTKSGGSRKFWITDRPNCSELASRALSCHSITKLTNIEILVDRANSFVEGMQKDEVPYWHDFPLYRVDEINTNQLLEPSPDDGFSSLSIPTRLVLLSHAQGNGFLSSRIPASAIEYLGLNNEESYDEFLESGIMEIDDSIETIPQSFSQGMLFQMCQERGCEVKKSWKKERLLQVLLEKDTSFKADFIIKNKPVRFVQEKKTLIERLSKVAQNRKRLFQLLFFI